MKFLGGTTRTGSVGREGFRAGLACWLTVMCVFHEALSLSWCNVCVFHEALFPSVSYTTEIDWTWYKRSMTRMLDSWDSVGMGPLLRKGTPYCLLTTCTTLLYFMFWIVNIQMVFYLTHFFMLASFPFKTCLIPVGRRINSKFCDFFYSLVSFLYSLFNFCEFLVSAEAAVRNSYPTVFHTRRVSDLAPVLSRIGGNAAPVRIVVTAKTESPGARSGVLGMTVSRWYWNERV